MAETVMMMSCDQREADAVASSSSAAVMIAIVIVMQREHYDCVRMLLLMPSTQFQTGSTSELICRPRTQPR